MSKAFRCDRCGGFYSVHDRKYFVEDYHGMNYDLCPNCSRELQEWMEKYKEAADDQQTEIH